jgi:hypothetical protein
MKLNKFIRCTLTNNFTIKTLMQAHTASCIVKTVKLDRILMPNFVTCLHLIFRELYRQHNIYMLEIYKQLC